MRCNSAQMNRCQTTSTLVKMEDIMLIIADNLNVRNAAWREALQKKDRKAIEKMSKELASAGAEVINIQCSLDGSADEECLPMAAEAVLSGGGLPVSLDSRNVRALRKTVGMCKNPPLINYLSADEKNPDEILSLVREARANLVLRAVRGTVPATLEAKLMILEDLIERANAADIPNERLFADPSVVHIAKGQGQEHIRNAHEALIALSEMVEPPINTILWVSNVTAGLPKKITSSVASAFLNYFAGAGLTAAFVNVKDSELMKAVYLIKSFREEIVFSPADMG